jgi:hypothetical protein
VQSLHGKVDIVLDGERGHESPEMPRIYHKPPVHSVNGQMDAQRYTTGGPQIAPDIGSKSKSKATSHGVALHATNNWLGTTPHISYRVAPGLLNLVLECAQYCMSCEANNLSSFRLQELTIRRESRTKVC